MDGFWFERPKSGRPEFVKGRMSIQVEKAVKFLQENQSNTGYVNADLLQSKGGDKLYFKLNDWKPTSKEGGDDSI